MRSIRLSGFLCVILSILSLGLEAQRNGHTLYGDFTISGEEPPLRSITFQLVLQNASGRTIDRLTVSPGGRYRFFNVPNGDYVILVETENRVAARMAFRIDEFRWTDIRKDIEMAWTTENPTPDPATVVHARSAQNEKRLKQASQELAHGKEGAARKLLEAVLADDPDDFEAWTELGSVHFRLKEWERAEPAYRKALELRPEYLPALLNLGKMYLANKNAAAAIDPLKEAVRIEPDSSEAQYFLGEAYLAIKKGSLAVGHLEAAIRLEPDKMAEVHLRLGALYEAAGMKPRAAEEYRRYLEKRPKSDKAAKLNRFIKEYGQNPPQ